ncbi:hypothetical protein J6590_012236 [Homalodisca vitripennis]|nr:hypothetical protein J6590_012236 [Homalodisca vitripennis]
MFAFCRVPESNSSLSEYSGRTRLINLFPRRMIHVEGHGVPVANGLHTFVRPPFRAQIYVPIGTSLVPSLRLSPSDRTSSLIVLLDVRQAPEPLVHLGRTTATTSYAKVLRNSYRAGLRIFSDVLFSPDGGRGGPFWILMEFDFASPVVDEDISEHISVAGHGCCRAGRFWLGLYRRIPNRFKTLDVEPVKHLPSLRAVNQSRALPHQISSYSGLSCCHPVDGLCSQPLRTRPGPADSLPATLDKYQLFSNKIPITDIFSPAAPFVFRGGYFSSSIPSLPVYISLLSLFVIWHWFFFFPLSLRRDKQNPLLHCIIFLLEA